MEHWKAKLAVNNDAPPEEDGAGGEEDADAEARPEAAEYEFLGSDAQRKNGDSQASGNAPSCSRILRNILAVRIWISVPDLLCGCMWRPAGLGPRD